MHIKIEMIIGTIVGVILTYLIWIGVTLTELKTTTSLTEYKVDQIHTVLQDLSERIDNR